ncbi:hypothetical protein LIX60_22700 [Streptomyces sp. S07_1.15]|nr:hypothetical protein [Streptomyces sp. S07_1.15]MCC3654220.1 hypothetical protein [Streptomyces sp. S07_1.15]
MDWWLWLVIAGAVAVVVIGAMLGIQARRRSGGVIAVRRGRAGGKGRS